MSHNQPSYQRYCHTPSRFLAFSSYRLLWHQRSSRNQRALCTWQWARFYFSRQIRFPVPQPTSRRGWEFYWTNNITDIDRRLPGLIIGLDELLDHSVTSISMTAPTEAGRRCLQTYGIRKTENQSQARRLLRDLGHWVHIACPLVESISPRNVEDLHTSFEICDHPAILPASSIKGHAQIEYLTSSTCMYCTYDFLLVL